MTTAPALRAGLAGALAAVQAEIPAIPKSEHADAGTFGYDYAGLDTVTAKILPLLGKHGLAFTAFPSLNSDGRFVLAYSLLHSSGESRSGEYPLLDKGSAQQVGSSITYARRYCLCAVTGVAPGGEDDDAADVPAQEMDKPKVRYTGADHERLAQQAPDELANGRGPADRKRGQLPADEWTTPPEDQPGSITPPQVRILQAHLSKFFDKTERDQRLSAAEKIIGRELTGPVTGRTASNLSYVEADQLIKELEGLMLTAEHAEPKLEPREALLELLALMGGATS